MGEYINLWGNPQSAKILIIGADISTRKKVNFPFGLEALEKCTLKNFNNPYFGKIYRNMDKLLEKSDTYNSNKLDFYKNLVCITNAIGKPLTNEHGEIVETAKNKEWKAEFENEPSYLSELTKLAKNKIVVLAGGAPLVEILTNKKTGKIYRDAEIIQSEKLFSSLGVFIISRCNNRTYDFNNPQNAEYVMAIQNFLKANGI